MEISADLDQVASLDDDTFSQIVEVFADNNLSEFERSLRIDSLTKQNNNVSGFVRVLRFVVEVLTESTDYADSLSNLDTYFENIVRDDESSKVGWSRVKNIVGDIQGYLVKEKVRDLKDRYSRVTSFRVTTDMRPVFSLERDQIDHLLYPFILKVETTSGEEFLCEFYGDELDRIESELQLAKDKHRQLVEKYGNI